MAPNQKASLFRDRFTGPQRPARTADVFLASTGTIFMSRVSQVFFVLAAILMAVVWLYMDDPVQRWVAAGFSVALLALAVLGYLRTSTRIGHKHIIRLVAVDMNGVWWTDRKAVGRVTWSRIVGIGFGEVHDTVGGMKSSIISGATLELFLVEGQNPGGELTDTVVVDYPAPPQGMPARRIRLSMSPADIEEMKASIGKWAKPPVPPFVGTFDVGVQNTLTGGIGGISS